MLGRVWLVVPLFTAIAVLPATLSIVTAGTVVVQLWTWHGHAQGFTIQGLTSAGLIIARTTASVTLVLILTRTTSWTRLLTGLRSLGVPRIIVMIIAMAYRYLILLLDTITDMFQARTARTLGAVRHDGGARAFIGSSAGFLIAKAHHLSEEIHQAMVSRGYRGDAVSLATPALRRVDLVAVVVVGFGSALLVGGDRLLGS